MRKLLMVLTMIICLPVSAQAAELKIGVFSMSEVAVECNAYKDALKKIQASFNTERTNLEKQEQDLQKKVKDFNMQESALSLEAREDRQIELMRLKRDLDDKKNAFMRKLSIAEDRAREDIARVILIAVSDYGKRNKYSLILDANNAGAFHIEPALDLTAEILKESNRVWKEKPAALTDGRPLTTGASKP